MSNQSQRSSISRKDFLRLVGISLGSLAASQILPGCQQATAEPTAALPTATMPHTQTAVPSTTATMASTATTAPATPAQLIRPEIIKLYPTVSSKVIQTHHTGVWSSDALVPDAVRQMVDESITRLTGINDAREAWAALFKPEERIAIKVNAFSNSRIWTHVPLVQAVTDSLVEAGLQPENIVIYDWYSSELRMAGFTMNPDGPGVRCYGSDSNNNEETTQVLERKIHLSNILTSCDALINMPVLKTHMMAGVTFAMKNHFGSYSSPSALHSPTMQEVAALNALPQIKDRTRLIIGDALTACVRYKNSYPYWDSDWTGDSIYMSYDPVALDTLGLEKLSQLLEADGGDPTSIQRMAKPALDLAVELGLGTNDPANMDIEEVTLS